MADLRYRCESIARELSALAVDLRERDAECAAVAVTVIHDRFVRLAARVLDGLDEEPVAVRPLGLRVIQGGRR